MVQRIQDQTDGHILLRRDIRKALVRMNTSQNELARKCGVSSGYMSQLLRRLRHPGPQVRGRLMKVLKMPFDELFEEVP